VAKRKKKVKRVKKKVHSEEKQDVAEESSRSLGVLDVRKPAISEAEATRQAEITTICKETGFARNVVEAARKTGYVKLQIMGFSDEESLRVAVLRVNPKLVGMFQQPSEKPVLIVKDTEYEYAEAAFHVPVLAGMGNQANRAMKEQRGIDAYIRRNGIRNVDKLVIERFYTPDGNNKVLSAVRVEYRKEKQ